MNRTIYVAIKDSDTEEVLVDFEHTEDFKLWSSGEIKGYGPFNRKLKEKLRESEGESKKIRLLMDMV